MSALLLHGNRWEEALKSAATIGHAITSAATNDTESAWLACIRDLSPAQRLEKACGLSQRGRRFAMEAIRRRHPAASPIEVRLRFIELAFGPALAADVGRWLEERAE